MKKLYTEPDYREFQRKRQRALRRSIKRRRNKSRRRSTFEHTRERKSSKRHTKSPIELIAPTCFSILKNADGTVAFLNEMLDRGVRRDVHVRLNGVKTIDPEAVALFVATIKGMTRSRISGDEPFDPVARQRLHDFGFADHVAGITPRTDNPGRMRLEHTGRQVKPEVAAKMVDFGTEQLHGDTRKHGPSVSAIQEAMSNTWHHAVKSRTGQQPWLAAVYCDTDQPKICFSVVDCGIGIFKSETLLRRLRHSVRYLLEEPGQLLRDLLEGKIPSRTRQKHRGRGLPGMYRACKNNQISNLVVLANDSYGNAGTDEFLKLENSFRGTLVYWEVTHDNF